MHKLTFFQLGNADTTLINLANGKKILVDYANVRSAESLDKRADLPRELWADLRAANRDSYDMVMFSHFDEDHVCGASEFFFLDHAGKYQGEGRAKIRTLVVGAAAIIESRNDLCEDAKAIQAEARHRLCSGYGIRVISRPGLLEDWLKNNGLTLNDRLHLITDAGKILPEFSLAADGLEVFIHSPFKSTLNATGVVVRNDEAVVFQARFRSGGRDTDVLFMADVPYDVIENIVEVTQDHDNEDRLKWDIMGLSHHSSYLSLSSEKGENKTRPVAKVQWLLEQQGQPRSLLVSTSDPIPGEDTDQPPHRQAAAYYKEVALRHAGRYIVTMEHPNKHDPRPLVIRIDGYGHTVENTPTSTGAGAVTMTPSPRVG